MEIVQRFHDFLTEQGLVKADRISVYTEKGELPCTGHCHNPSFDNHYTIKALLTEYDCSSASIRKLFCGWRAFAMQYRQCKKLQWESGLLKSGVSDLLLIMDVEEEVVFTEATADEQHEITFNNVRYRYDPSALDEQGQAELIDLPEIAGVQRVS